MNLQLEWLNGQERWVGARTVVDLGPTNTYGSVCKYIG